MSKQNKWKDKRYIALLRQSIDKDGAASTEAQLDYIEKKCAELGMHYVHKIALEGVTGSLPGRREDLADLLERKRTSNDFDVIVVQVPDRLTRGGGEHGMWFEHECKRNGIRIFFAGDDTPEGPFSGVVRVSKYDAAKDSSFTTGKRSAQGQEWAKKQGFFRTSGPTPIGCYRLYFDHTHAPRYIIRNLIDGRQEQIDPESGKVIGTFGTVGKKSRNRFKKQRNEYSLLIPGDREQVQTVRVIFYLRFKKGWRGERITDFLNRNGRPAPKGGGWSQRQVESIYENEAYTGVTYNNQTYSGRFVRGDEEHGYVELDRDECEMVTAKCFTPVYLPMSTWKNVDQPHTVHFLPRDVRELAIAGQQKMWEHRLDPARPKKPVNAHPASFYLLSNKLMAVQDGEALSGTLSGRKDKAKTMYYRHLKGKRGHIKGSIFGNLIPAKPLHDELLKWLGEILLDVPNLRSMLTEIVVEQRQRVAADASSDGDLEAERAELDERIRLIASTFTGAALKAAESDINRLNARRNEIEQILSARKSEQAKTQKPVKVVVEEAIEHLQHLAEHLHALPPDPLRQLIDLLVQSATVDMATKAVTFEIAVPSWTLHKPSKGEKVMCPPASLRSPTGDWTHRPLALLECDYEHLRGSNRPPCYRCQRKAA